MRARIWRLVPFLKKYSHALLHLTPQHGNRMFLPWGGDPHVEPPLPRSNHADAPMLTTHSQLRAIPSATHSIGCDSPGGVLFLSDIGWQEKSSEVYRSVGWLW